MQGKNGTATTCPPSLTAREMMIVLLMGTGRTTSQIATVLELRPRTVENHRRHIYEKLRVGSQSQAIARAIALGLFQPAQPAAAGRSPETGRRQAGRATLVVLLGAAGKARDEIARLLVTEGIAFVSVEKAEGLIHDHWLSWHRGATVVVVINPRPLDKAVIDSLAAPVVEICEQDKPGQALLAGVMTRKAGGLIAGSDVAAGLLPAMEATAQGLLVMSRRYAAALLRLTVTEPAAGPRLTAREQDILDSIARGYTIRQTARALGIAVKTVENVQALLFRKLGAHNRMDALTIAYEGGLIAQSMLYSA